MDEGMIKEVEDILRVARLIESCQTWLLISPEDRKNYFLDLNHKSHAAIKALLAA